MRTSWDRIDHAMGRMEPHGTVKGFFVPSHGTSWN